MKKEIQNLEFKDYYKGIKVKNKFYIPDRNVLYAETFFMNRCELCIHFAHFTSTLQLIRSYTLVLSELNDCKKLFYVYTISI